MRGRNRWTQHLEKFEITMGAEFTEARLTWYYYIEELTQLYSFDMSYQIVPELVRHTRLEVKRIVTEEDRIFINGILSDYGY